MKTRFGIFATDQIERKAKGMSEEIQIELHFRLSDFDDEEEQQEGPEDPLDDWEGCASIFVERTSADSTRVRVAEPAAITPFGPLGPEFNVGDIIDLVPLTDGSYRFLRMVRAAHPWTLRIGGVTVERLNRDKARMLLAEVLTKGGNWEYVAGNLRVQFPNDRFESDEPANVTDLFARLRAVVDRTNSRQIAGSPASKTKL